MPAEKLSKKRVIQLIVVLIILLSAFFYRSCHYIATNTGDNNPNITKTE